MSPFVRGPSVRHMDRTAARSVLFITLAVFSLTFRGGPGTDAARVDLETTRAIALERTLALPESALLENLAEQPQGRGVVSRRPSDGRLVGTSGLGGPLVMAPLVLAGTGLEMVQPPESSRAGAVVRAAAGWRNSFLSAITAHLVVLVALRLGAARLDAWLGGLTYAFTTFAWPQARAWEVDVQVTMLLFASLLFILRIRESFDRLEDPLRLDLLAVGSTLGLALFTSITSLPAVIVLGAAIEVVLWRGMRRLNTTRWQPKDHERARPGVVAGLVLVPLLLGGVATLIHDSLVWGRAMSFPALRPTGPDLEASLGGLLFSPGRGLLVLAPGLLLVPLGWRALVRGGELLYGRTVLGLLLAVLLVPVFLEPWHGGRTYGPRLLLPLLPFAWVLAVRAAPWIREVPWRRRLVVILLALGLFHQLPAVGVDTSTHHELAFASHQDGPESLESIQWDLPYAAPWAHWRILRHRIASDDELFPVREIFFEDRDEVITPTEGSPAFSHLAALDLLRQEPVLGGLLVFGSLASVLWGAWIGFRALNRTAT